MLPSPCIPGFVLLRTWLGLLIEVSTSPNGLGLSKARAPFASVPLLQPQLLALAELTPLSVFFSWPHYREGCGHICHLSCLGWGFPQSKDLGTSGLFAR